MSLDPDALNRLRAICLGFPEAVESGGVGSPSFKVREKIFAMQHPMDGRPSLWFKAPRGFQDVLVGAAPERFFVPPYVGHHGWVGRWLDDIVDWDELTDLITDSYRMTAPKRLAQTLSVNPSRSDLSGEPPRSGVPASDSKLDRGPEPRGLSRAQTSGLHSGGRP